MSCFSPRQLLHGFFCSFLLTLSVQSVASACLCFPPEKIEDRIGAANLIFVGTVEDVSEIRSWLFDEIGYEATLVVDTYWKGGSGNRRVKVRTRSPFGACGFFFEKGKRYLVYAQDGWFSVTTHNCGGTAEIRKAGKDLETLGAVFE